MDERNEWKTIDLTKDEAYSLAEVVDTLLLDCIRSDAEIDSNQWLRNVIHAYEKLCDYSGYNGVTE